VVIRNPSEIVSIILNRYLPPEYAYSTTTQGG
jgi:hypothetical protein